MKKCILIIFGLFFSIISRAQSDDYKLIPFEFYTADGEKITYHEIVKDLATADIILFGEHHNDAIIHWIQLRLAKDLASANELVLGAEFFERDDQLKLDEYISGLIPARNFEAEARLWNNYKTDYKPLVDFAREKKIKFIATNVPRRYAALVAKSGLDTLRTLPKEAKRYMAKLPIKFSMETPGYTEMEEMMGGGHGMNMTNMIQAQAIKDATMAESILRNLKKGETFLHLNGDYHSANFGGIFWYLNTMAPKKKVKIIKSFSSPDLSFTSEMKNSGDFILVVPNDSPKSY